MIPYIVIVQQYERIGVFFMGRFTGLRGAGLHFLFWPFHRSVRIDTREVVIDIPRQTNITEDNAPIDIDFLVYMRPISDQADKAILEVVDYRSAVVGIATTNLRAVIGEMSLDDVLSQRERINHQLRARLDEVTNRWGIKVTQVEIREIEPPRDIQEAMNRQMSAERVRRAAIIEAEGVRQAAVTVAEGEKQAAILKSEGIRQSEILQAEGDQQAAKLRADGFAVALDRVNEVAKGVGGKAMSLQYFDTLKELGSSPSSKFIFPMEFTNMLKPFLGMGSNDEDESKDD
jgi:regulator of protease activity HflC (stomatin/prohibitin superfamily)